jgi:hypothetical protein
MGGATPSVLGEFTNFNQLPLGFFVNSTNAHGPRGNNEVILQCGNCLMLLGGTPCALGCQVKKGRAGEQAYRY